MVQEAKVYDWYVNQKITSDYKPTLRDMNAGIGYMLELVSKLIDSLETAIKQKNGIQRTQNVSNEMTQWFESVHDSTKFYEIIEKYVKLGTTYDRQEQKLTKIREERNFFVHNCVYFKKQSELRTEFNRLHNVIPMIKTANAALINDIEHSSKIQNTINNKNKNDQDNQIRSIIKRLTQKMKTEGKKKLLISAIGNEPDIIGMQIKSLKDKLKEMGYAVCHDSKSPTIWYIKL